MCLWGYCLQRLPRQGNSTWKVDIPVLLFELENWFSLFSPQAGYLAFPAVVWVCEH